MTAVIGAIALVATLNAPEATAQGQKVLKFIPQADLRILDPITTTAYITRNHGYMIYDTLFATDAKFQVQPQMVDKYELSGDKLTYTFTLRDGLKFHDGQPVRSADCIASLERWSKPCLVMAGDKDPVLGIPAAKIFERRIPTAGTMIVIEDAGHFLQEDKGEDVAERIVAWLDD
jgi:ABC-type transport system substrate-binding protein